MKQKYKYFHHLCLVSITMASGQVGLPGLINNSFPRYCIICSGYPQEIKTGGQI